MTEAKEFSPEARRALFERVAAEMVAPGDPQPDAPSSEQRIIALLEDILRRVKRIEDALP